MATIKDVAKYAGLSVSVVSKYLKAPGSVREDTRVRVEGAIRALNYRPSVAAQSLRTGSTHLIMAVYPMLTNPVFMAYVLALQEKAWARGYSVLIVGEEQLRAALDADRPNTISPIGLVDAIVYCMPTNKELVRSISRFAGNRPQISASRCAFLPGVPNIGWDNEHATRALTEHMIAQGHRDIAFILSAPDDEKFPNSRRKGYRAAMAAHGLEPPREYAVETLGPNNLQLGYEAARGLMALDRPPTAIVADNDFIAVGCCHYLQEHGLRVPEDVAVSGMSDSPPAEIVQPPLTSVPFPAEESAEWTIQTLMAMLDPAGAPQVPADTFLVTEPIIRRSTDPTQPAYIIPRHKRKY